MTESDGMQDTYNDGIHGGMQVNEDQVPREIRERPMFSIDNRQVSFTPGPSSSWARVPRRPKSERHVGGLRPPTAIWICVSGVLAVLAICIGVVLGSELQKSRKLQNSGVSKTTTVTVTASTSGTLGYSCSECSLSATGTATAAASSPTSATTRATSSSTSTPTSGWCTFHTTQYKRNEPENPYSTFKLDFRFLNAAGAVIGTFSGIPALSGHPVSIVTVLPHVLNVTAQSGDDDPLQFEYDGAFWNSSDSTHCKFGGYSTTQREGDCGFTCIE